MTDSPTIVVLCGGTSNEREVSLRTGASLMKGLEPTCKVELIKLDEDALPQDLHPDKHVILPALHGAFGEDGMLQSMLESRGFAFAGSASEASKLCFNKTASKARVEKSGVDVVQHLDFEGGSAITVDEILAITGDGWIIKPVCSGSSVGLYAGNGVEELERILPELSKDCTWMAEKHIRGMELTVAVLDGEALETVEIEAASGIYDYTHKYTPNHTTYHCPARLKGNLQSSIRQLAKGAFYACGCRDFARVDFMLSENGTPYFLEINTMPGMTETSLLPKSAAGVGIDFNNLCKRMIEPAVGRFQACVSC